jgi:hypothetical protein
MTSNYDRDLNNAMEAHFSGNENLPHCDMTHDCIEKVTHIGSKGYVYCKAHAVSRRNSGYESTREMRAWELSLLESGKSLPSYKIGRKPA